MRDIFHLIRDTWPRGGILRPKNESGIRENNGTSINAPECSFSGYPSTASTSWSISVHHTFTISRWGWPWALACSKVKPGIPLGGIFDADVTHRKNKARPWAFERASLEWNRGYAQAGCLTPAYSQTGRTRHDIEHLSVHPWSGNTLRCDLWCRRKK